MKKIVLTGLFVVGMVGLSAKTSVSVIPYSTDPESGKLIILLGQDVYAKSALSLRQRRQMRCEMEATHCRTTLYPGVWAVPHAFDLPEVPTLLDFGVELFNKMTMYCFARAIIDEYPGSPKSSPKEPMAGLSGFIADAAVDAAESGLAEGQREFGGEGAYGKESSLKKDFNDAVSSLMQEQWRGTPGIQVNDHYYYFLRVPFICSNFLDAKRRYLRGIEGVDELEAHLGEFTWVDGSEFVRALKAAKEASDEDSITYCFVWGYQIELSRELVHDVCKDGVIAAIERIV